MGLAGNAFEGEDGMAGAGEGDGFCRGMRGIRRGVAGEADQKAARLYALAGQIEGRSFCPLGEAAAWPVQGFLAVFPEEFEHYIANGRSLVAA